MAMLLSSTDILVLIGPIGYNVLRRAIATFQATVIGNAGYRQYDNPNLGRKILVPFNCVTKEIENIATNFVVAYRVASNANYQCFGAKSFFEMTISSSHN